MEERINPENWKDIFSDTLYIIHDPNAIVTQKVEMIPKTSVTEAAQNVTTEAPKITEVPKPIATATVSPSIPVSPSLNTVKEQTTPKAPELTITLKPIGKYSNGILILMHASYTMTTAQQEMLGKIVKAVQLEYNDCGVLQVNTPVSLKDLEVLKPRIILSFGLPTDAFTPKLAKDFYAIQKHNSTILLLADSLANLEKTVALKSNLWNAMKEMFGVK
jgi:hypothetical protein